MDGNIKSASACTWATRRKGTIEIVRQTILRDGNFLSFKNTFLCLPILLLAGCSPLDKHSQETTKPAQEGKSQSSEALSDFITEAPKLSKNQVIDKYVSAKFKTDKVLSASAYLEAAKKANDDADHQAAAVLVKEALVLSPKSAAAWYESGRAKVYSSTSNDQDALSDLKKAVSLNYNDSDVYELLAQTYDGRSDPNAAIAALTEGIKKYPTQKRLYICRAALLTSQGRYAESKADYDTAIKLDPQDFKAYALRGQALESLSKYQEALLDYDRVIASKEPNEAISKREVAIKLKVAVLTKLKRHKECIATLTEVINESPADDELLKLRGDQYAALKEYTKAIEDYNQSINANPHFAQSAHKARSEAYAAIGKDDLANADRLKSQALQNAPAEKVLYERPGSAKGQ